MIFDQFLYSWKSRGRSKSCRLLTTRSLTEQFVMAPGKSAVDFNNIINAGEIVPSYRLPFDLACWNVPDRQRRKNEALAQEIFSKSRRSSAQGAGVINRKPGTGPSLASRVGIAKVWRKKSTVDITQFWYYIAKCCNHSQARAEADQIHRNAGRCRQRWCRMDPWSSLFEQSRGLSSLPST